MSIQELDPKTIKFGRNIRGWSQRQLGEATGLRPWRIWAIENGVYEPRVDELARILKALSTND